MPAVSGLLLAFDVGNTNTVIGLFDGKHLTRHWRLTTAAERTSDEYGILMWSLFQAVGHQIPKVSGTIVASVVPPLTSTVEALSQDYFGCKALVVGPGVKTGMPILYENPREVGADRIVNAVAAYELLGGPVIAVDFGTATTWDCVSAQGEYLGGVIFPGIHIAMDALFERASMLHRVEFARPKSVIGRTTTAALQSGMLYGYAGVVDSMVDRIRSELGAEARVVATGGLAGRVAAECRSIDKVEPFLTLEGLRLIYERNRAAGAESEGARARRDPAPARARPKTRKER